MESLKIFTRD